MTKRFPERNHNRRAAGACKSQLQVAAVINLSAKFTELIGNCMNHLPAHIGKKYTSVPRNDVGTAQIQELACHQDAVAARLSFQVDIDLKGICAIEHLPCGGASGAGPFENGLQKTVEEDLDPAARSLSLIFQTGACERRLRKPNAILWRLVVPFRGGGLTNLLPHGDCLHAAFAALLQVFLHQRFLAGGHDLVHKIDPLLCRKMFHLFPPESFPAASALPSAQDGQSALVHKGMWREKKYKELNI